MSTSYACGNILVRFSWDVIKTMNSSVWLLNSFVEAPLLRGNKFDSYMFPLYILFIQHCILGWAQWNSWSKLFAFVMYLAHFVSISFSNMSYSFEIIVPKYLIFSTQGSFFPFKTLKFCWPVFSF